MMDQKEVIFIRNATIIDPSSGNQRKKLDLLVEDGVIARIGKNLKEPFGARIVDQSDLFVSPGWMDLHVNVQDPGFEYKEDIGSALNAAASGGYTAVLSCSTTNPPVDGKSGIQYQIKKSRGHLCDFYPSGTVSRAAKGEELAEMYDMYLAGAVAFCDFKSNMENSQLLKLALLYNKSFDGLVMNYPTERYLDEGSVVSEGLISTQNGLTGVPSIAEVIGIQRVLKLLEYSDHRLHFTSVSTSDGVQLIAGAKKKGLRITAAVCAANLLFTEHQVENFDTNFKLKPALSDERNRKQLVKGLLNGTLDLAVSDHWPQNIEEKDCEFEKASFGMSTLECSYAMINTALYEKADQQKMVEIMAVAPRRILNLDIPVLKEGEAANLTLYQPHADWKFDIKKSKSRSRNNPLHGYPFKGRVIGVINNKQSYFN